MASAQSRAVAGCASGCASMTLDRPTTADEALRAGLEAYRLGRWEEARARFEQAQSIKDAPEAAEGLGKVSWVLEDGATAIAAHEHAYRLYRVRDDARRWSSRYLGGVGLQRVSRRRLCGQWLVASRPPIAGRPASLRRAGRSCLARGAYRALRERRTRRGVRACGARHDDRAASTRYGSRNVWPCAAWPYLVAIGNARCKVCDCSTRRAQRFSVAT